MARAKILAETRIHGQRQEAGGRGDAVLLDDHRPVVQRRAVLEDRHQQVVADLGVERDAAFGVVAQANLPLDGDDGAGALGRQHLRRHRDLFDGLVHGLALGQIAEERRAAQVRERTPDVGLEQDDGGKDDVADQIADQPVHRLELDQPRHVEQRHRQRAADRHLRGPGAANEREDLVDQDRDDGDVDDIAPAYRRPAQRLGDPGEVHRSSGLVRFRRVPSGSVRLLRVIRLRSASRIASTVRTTSTISFTPCTRTMCAPPMTAAATAAAVPHSRRPARARRGRLRETTSSTGRPAAAVEAGQLRQARQQLQAVRGLLGEPDSGVEDHPVAGDAGRDGRLNPFGQFGGHLVDDRAVVRLLVHLARPAAVVHEHQRRAGLGDDGGQRRIIP